MKYLDMTAENTTLDEGEREKVNGNPDDLEELLNNREKEAAQAAMMDEVGHKEHAEDMECGGEEVSAERDPFLATNKHESLFCCKRKGANYLVMQTI